MTLIGAWTNATSQISQRTNEGSELPINPVTGVQNTSIPLYSISDYDINHSVSLQYSGGGILVEQVSDWLGLSWSINTGGYIQRIVRGLPDDNYTKGYYYHHGEVTGDPLGVAVGEYDTEPDLYTVMFNGRAGQFFFDDEGEVVWKNMEPFILIPRTPHTGEGIEYWDFIDDLGNKYVFGWNADDDDYFWHEEVSFLSEDSSNESERTKLKWFLTEMTSAQGHAVTYQYAQEQYRVWSPKPQSITFRAGGVILAHTASTIEYSLIGRDISTYRLSGIEYPNYSVVFTSAFSRTDVDIYSELDRIDLAPPYDPPKALTLIQVTNKHNDACIATIALDKSYTVATIDQFEEDSDWIEDFNGTEYPDMLRLFLDGVYFIPCEVSNSCAEADETGYVFEYYDRDMLSRSVSFTQDLWGYNNGEIDNASLFPNIDEFGGGLPISFLQGSNRDPNIEYAQAGALKSVTHPSGLVTTFNYELNEILQKQYRKDKSKLFLKKCVRVVDARLTLRP